MKEEIVSFPKSDNTLFAIQLCGTSYCDGSYRINRLKSSIHCFEYIVSGTGTILTDGGKLHPKEGDVYFLKAGEDHIYYSDANDPWVKIWFNIKGTLVESLVRQYEIFDIRLFENCRIKSLFDEFINNADSKMDFRLVEKQNAIVLHQIIQEMSAAVHKADSKYTEDALMIKEYIDLNYSRTIKIQELSELIYRSPSQTIRIFKKNFGIAPYEYTLKRKIQVARQLLKSTNLPIGEIASELGFTNDHYFSSCFKAQTGITPSQYRKQ